MGIYDLKISIYIMK
ncbi:hypothetical protein YPPY09_2123, partial [Yersinia pestis PY-09]